MQWLLLLLVAVLTGCAAPHSRPPRPPPGDARTLIARYIPASVADRGGWAEDIYTPMAVLGIPLTPENVCAVVAVTEQESGFHADPVIPNLPAIARAEIERRRKKLGIPSLVLEAALAIESTDGRTYRERIDHAKTERELSEIYEDFIGRVPFGRTFLESRNPVRTGGPMQVNVDFARAQAKEKRYPYAVVDSIRDEAFARRGGMYFGIAHLLDYRVSYDQEIFRFADYNAGQYASRNAAFQAALAKLAHRSLALDGDLVPAGGAYEAKPGHTEAAALSLAKELGMDASGIRRDLERENRRDFESTALYAKVFELADAREGGRLPRAILPVIELHTPKTKRRLTTAWFARSVAARQRECLTRR